MEFREDKNFLQREDEPPRRFFTDTHFFDLYVWYREPEFKNIAGFQLVYRSNPFDTDHEYFISHFPTDPNEFHNDLGKTGELISAYAAPKVIKPTSDNPPSSLFQKMKEKISSLPPEIQAYVESHVIRDI